MGVPRLFPFLKRRYPLAFSDQREQYDHIYIDGNACLYPIADTTVDTITIARMLLEVAQEYHNVYGGVVHVYLDGAAHMGKIRHQRLRRFLYSPISLRENPDGSVGLWSQAVFTPGTSYMHTINKYCNEHINEYAGVGTFSGSDEPGEGEHKIIRDAKLLPTSTRVGIVGKDADLIMLGMGMEKHNVTIFRHYDEDDQNTYRASDFVWHIHCPKLRELILAEMKLDEIWSFIIASFFIGTDFMGPVPECSDIFKILPKILKKRIKLYDPQTKSIRWKGIFMLAQRLSGGKIDEKWVGKIDDPEMFNLLYYVTYSPFPVEKELLVQQWVITIEWIFRYYHDGLDTASRSWQYNSPFSPTLSSILEVGIRSVKGLEMATKQVPPLTQTQALCAALPPWLHVLLPPNARREIEKYPEYYPYSFKMNEPMETPIIPTIPYSIVSTLPSN